MFDKISSSWESFIPFEEFKYPKGFIVGGALSISFDNAAFLVIEGFDNTYKALNPNYLLKWKMINDYYSRKYKYLNLNAVVGEFAENHQYTGLNEMKLGFNTVVTEKFCLR